MHQYSLITAGLSRWASPLGLGNYIDAAQELRVLVGDADHARSSRSRSVFLETILGLAMALAMKEAFKGQGMLRTVVLVPWAVLTVVTAIMWKSIFDAEPRLRERRARHQHGLARRRSRRR